MYENYLIVIIIIIVFLNLNKNLLEGIHASFYVYRTDYFFGNISHLRFIYTYAVARTMVPIFITKFNALYQWATTSPLYKQNAGFAYKKLRQRIW